MVQVPTTRPHTRILWGEDSNLFCMAWSVLKRYELKLTISHNCRILHGMAVACGPGGVGGLPLRPLHPRPQRQCPGSVQRGGEEVRTAHHVHQSKSISHDIDLGRYLYLQILRSGPGQSLLFSRFPCNLGSDDSPDSDYVRVYYPDLIKTNLPVARLILAMKTCQFFNSWGNVVS